MLALVCRARTARGARRRTERGLACFVAAGVLWLSLCATAIAQLQMPAPRPVDPSLVDKLERRGDLELEDASMAETLLRVGELWGVNLVFSKSIEGRVTGAFKQAPLSEILDAVLLSNGYGYRPVGQSLVVVPLAELGEVNPMFATAAVPMTHCEPSKVVESLRLLCSPQGKIQAIDVAGVLLIADFPDRLQVIRGLALEMDTVAASAIGPFGQPAAIDVAHFAPQYASAIAMKDTVQAVLSPTGKVAVLAAENRLVVADCPFNLGLAARVVQQLDTPRQQVRITALIYDLSLQDMDRLGVNWGHALKYRHDSADEAQTIFSGATDLAPLAVPGAPGSVMTLKNLSRHVDLAAVVQALSQAQDSRLLANPNVTVVDNEPATIAIVTEIPYQQLTQTQQGGSIGTTAFREAGVKLEVTPQIAADATIQMSVTPSFSRLTGFTPGEQPQPIIDRREANTTVRVANGQTLVIGGLRQRQEITDTNGVPFLKDIKYVGALFRSRHTTIRESELVVFLRPEIVTVFDCGLPREQAAREVSRHMLGGVPTANSPLNPFPQAPVIVEELEEPSELHYIPRLPPVPAAGRPYPITPFDFPQTALPPAPRLPAPLSPEPRIEALPPPAPQPRLPQEQARPRPPSEDQEEWLLPPPEAMPGPSSRRGSQVAKGSSLESKPESLATPGAAQSRRTAWNSIFHRTPRASASSEAATSRRQ